MDHCAKSRNLLFRLRKADSSLHATLSLRNDRLCFATSYASRRRCKQRLYEGAGERARHTPDLMRDNGGRALLLRLRERRGNIGKCCDVLVDVSLGVLH